MTPDIGGIPLYVILLILFIVIRMLVSASNSALDHIDRNKIKEMNEDDPDNKRIDRVMKLIRKPSAYHYANAVLGRVLLICSFVCVCMILILRESKQLYQNVLITIAFLLLYFALTDLLPRKLAIQSAERYSIALSGFQRFVYWLTLPLVKLCLGFANLFLFIMRKDTDVDDPDFSEDRVMSMLDKGQETGDIKEEGRRMIDSIFEFDDLLAYEIMTPRTDVFMIDIGDDKEEYIEELMELTHSRIPVYEGDPDNIIGILHIKDYLLQAGNVGFDNVNIRDILREPYFVPETKNIDSLFVELQKSKQHIALLIDEYGGFSGLVSIEDIIEQIVGDIDDEFDEDDRIIDKVSEDVFIVDGNVYLDDLEDETGVALESETSETVGGFLIDLMGEIPKEDVHYPPVKYENYLFTILEVRDRRIEKIKIVVEDEDDKALQEDER
ncbi:MAG: HlyC/CorC family transporter [Mogibacterium sp.]|nr:HlyC/CorC family transporter [Mogibacterium sp.]